MLGFHRIEQIEVFLAEDLALTLDFCYYSKISGNLVRLLLKIGLLLMTPFQIYIRDECFEAIHSFYPKLDSPRLVLAGTVLLDLCLQASRSKLRSLSDRLSVNKKDEWNGTEQHSHTSYQRSSTTNTQSVEHVLCEEWSSRSTRRPE